MDRESQYLQMFFDEAAEYIQSLNENILILEEEPENIEVINAVFRSAHSLKGMSATMGFSNLTELTHKIENMLDCVRNNELAVNEEIIDCLFSGFDLINLLVDEIKETGTEKTSITDYINSIEFITDKEKDLENDAEKEELSFALTAEEISSFNEQIKETDIIYQLKVSIKNGSILSSVRAYMVLKKADELGFLLKSQPEREEIEEMDQFAGQLQIILVSQMEKDEIKDELLAITDVASVEITQVEMAKEEPGKTDKKVVQKKNNKAKKKKENNKNKDINVAPTVRVDINKLDTLMNMVGELLINKTRLEGLRIDEEIYQDIIQQLDRVTMELHHVVMQIRMVPIAGIFNRFPRMVRDLAKSLDKEINLVIEGAETELDRSIIDELADPLVHLIRNAVDHGIEKPELRRQQGKDPVGKIILQAYQKGSEIIIKVEDDGGGIDPDKIASIAVNKGLIKEQEVASLNKREKLSFVFNPGFSTTEKITDVSGRGVGMDVVRSVVEKLDGQVVVDSFIGEKTVFTISLPLTLAITQALMLEIKNEIFAIPLNLVSETLLVKSADIKQVRGQDVIVLRESTIPLVCASNCLNLEKEKKSYKKNREIPVVIVKSGDREIGLIVDELLNQQEIVIKPLGKYLANTRHISGATIVGDGDVALILDVRNIA